MSIADAIREAAESSGKSWYEIAKKSGVNYAAIHRFLSGESDIRLSTADKLAEYFGMRMTKPKKPKI